MIVKDGVVDVERTEFAKLTAHVPDNLPPHLDHEFYRKLAESNHTAVANGYDLRGYKARDLCEDLANYDVDFEGYEIEQLMPYMKAWLASNPPLCLSEDALGFTPTKLDE